METDRPFSDTETDTADLQGDLMREAMTAIRNIAGALRAWDLKPDADRLAAIFAISDALYTLDARSRVSLDLVWETLHKTRETHPDLALMLPKAYEWVETVGFRQSPPEAKVR